MSYDRYIVKFSDELSYNESVLVNGKRLK